MRSDLRVFPGWPLSLLPAGSPGPNRRSGAPGQAGPRVLEHLSHLLLPEASHGCFVCDIQALLWYLAGRTGKRTSAPMSTPWETVKALCETWGLHPSGLCFATAVVKRSAPVTGLTYSPAKPLPGWSHGDGRTQGAGSLCQAQATLVGSGRLATLVPASPEIIFKACLQLFSLVKYPVDL